MQKKILAAAIGGLLMAPAAYAVDVSISGRLSTGFENYDVDGPAVPNADAELLLSDQSSSVVFNLEEDLGGGMSVWAHIDNRFNFQEGGFSASGDTQIGLEGGFGRIGIGREDLHYNALFAYDASRAGSLQSWVTGSVFSQVAGAPIANTTRTPNTITWNGAFGAVTATLAYSTSPLAADEVEGGGFAPTTPVDEGEGMNAALRWSGGPLNLGASLWTAESEDGTVEQDSQRVWAAYQFGNIGAAFGYDISSITVAGVETERTAFAVPVKISLGADTFYVKAAMADDLEVGGTDVTDSGATIMSIGWDHALSKRTVVGVHYTDLDNDDNGTYNFFANSLSGAPPGLLGAGTDANQIYLGIAHFY